MSTEVLKELLDYGEHLETLNDDHLAEQVVADNSVQNWISGVVMALGEIIANKEQE